MRNILLVPVPQLQRLKNCTTRSRPFTYLDGFLLGALSLAKRGCFARITGSFFGVSRRESERWSSDGMGEGVAGGEKRVEREEKQK